MPTEDSKATNSPKVVIPPKRSNQSGGEMNQDCDLIEGAPQVPLEAALARTDITQTPEVTTFPTSIGSLLADFHFHSSSPA